MIESGVADPDRPEAAATPAEALRLKEAALELFSVRQIIPSLLRSLALFSLLHFALVSVHETPSLLAAVGDAARFGLTLALILEPMAVALRWYRRRKARRALPGEWAARLEKSYVESTQPNWLPRAAWRGFWLALWIGVPVGVLMAVSWPSGDLLGGNPMLAVVLFVALTFLWTFPAAVLLRFALMRRLRPLVSVRDN